MLIQVRQGAIINIDVILYTPLSYLSPLLNWVQELSSSYIHFRHLRMLHALLNRLLSYLYALQYNVQITSSYIYSKKICLVYNCLQNNLFYCLHACTYCEFIDQLLFLSFVTH